MDEIELYDWDEFEEKLEAETMASPSNYVWPCWNAFVSEENTSED